MILWLHSIHKLSFKLSFFSLFKTNKILYPKIDFTLTKHNSFFLNFISFSGFICFQSKRENTHTHTAPPHSQPGSHKHTQSSIRRIIIKSIIQKKHNYLACLFQPKCLRLFCSQISFFRSTLAKNRAVPIGTKMAIH